MDLPFARSMRHLISIISSRRHLSQQIQQQKHLASKTNRKLKKQNWQTAKTIDSSNNSAPRAEDSQTDNNREPSAIIDPNDMDGDGFTVEDGDCNDNDPNTYPDAPDIPRDDIDQNCDGQDNDANPENGGSIFNANCTDCHFNGGFEISVASSTNYQVYMIIRYGFGPMPAFNDILSVEEIFDVLLYVRENHE